MKRLVFTSMILAGVLLAQTGFSQVYVRANIGFGQPGVYCPPPPPRVIYEQAYPEPYYPNYYNNRVVVERGYEYRKSRYNREPYYDRSRVRYERYKRERRNDRW